LPLFEQATALHAALHTTLTISDERYRNRALAALAPHLAKHPSLQSAWPATLRSLAQHGRPVLLGDLAALGAWYTTFAGPEECAEVARAIIEVCKAWG
jgi:hypothetical protein